MNDSKTNTAEKDQGIIKKALHSKPIRLLGSAATAVGLTFGAHPSAASAQPNQARTEISQEAAGAPASTSESTTVDTPVSIPKGEQPTPVSLTTETATTVPNTTTTKPYDGGAGGPGTYIDTGKSGNTSTTSVTPSTQLGTAIEVYHGQQPHEVQAQLPHTGNNETLPVEIAAGAIGAGLAAEEIARRRGYDPQTANLGTEDHQ